MLRDCKKNLPRFIQEDATVLVGIKRQLQYNHYYMTGIVRPLETMKATRVLLDTSLYKDNNVLMNREWKEHIENLLAQAIHVTPTNVEIDEQYEGNTDVLLHGVYCSEQVVDRNDSIFNVAPSEGFSPLGLFTDKFCEELCFSQLFFGEPRKYHELAKKQY